MYMLRVYCKSVFILAHSRRGSPSIILYSTRPSSSIQLQSLPTIVLSLVFRLIDILKGA